MNDLISRKALMRKLFFAEDGRKYPTRDIDNFPVTVSLENLRKIIRDEPTAYDVKKVVRQLEKNKINCNNSNTIFNTDDFVKLDKAIKIVRGGGGVDE